MTKTTSFQSLLLILMLLCDLPALAREDRVQANSVQVDSAQGESVQEESAAPYSAQQSAVLHRIDELAALGVPELGLSFVERKQPVLQVDNVTYWLLLEQKRYRLLQQLEMWQAIVDRSLEHQAYYKKFLITYADRNWFGTQHIKALLQLKRYAAALTELQKNLWHEKSHADTDVVALWRRLIIRSYLNLNTIEDAQRAMRRYRQDYGELDGEDGMEWTLLQAQLLLRTGGAPEAVHMLESMQQPDAVALLLLARQQASLLSNESAEQQLIERQNDTELDAKQQSVYWYARLKLAVLRQDYAAQVEALEQLFFLDSLAHVFSVFTDAESYIGTDRLWQAYEQYGIALANWSRLLRGDDDAWYSQASNLFEKQPRQARALLAVLAFNARQSEHRSLAMQHIAALLQEHEQGLPLVNQLFMHSDRISNIETVPAEVRYRLVDYALQVAELDSAARLMETLQKPPEGQDQFEWSLRRARILILGGEFQEGVQILLGLLDGDLEPEEQQVDAYMQVVFDLQNVQQHRYALAAFEKLEQVSLSAKLRREIAYWKAESYQQLKDFEQAAFLFLKSAIPLENKIDPWFHTASFRAAESLAQAGLIEDARSQYLRLLRMTLNTARQAVIRQRLQQLRLKQSHELSADQRP